jgi:excinuclease ABC subunit B
MKSVRDLTDRFTPVAEKEAPHQSDHNLQLTEQEIITIISELETQMRSAAAALEFEQAAIMRDRVHELRMTLADTISEIPEWDRARVLSGEEMQRPSSLV